MYKRYLAVGYKLIILQLALLGIAVVVFACVGNWHGVLSALLGGGAWILPSLYFVRKLFKAKTGNSPEKIVRTFLLGEGIKMLLSVVMLVLILMFIAVDVWGFLSGYAAAVAASLLMPFLYRVK